MSSGVEEHKQAVRKNPYRRFDKKTAAVVREFVLFEAEMRQLLDSLQTPAKVDAVYR